MEAPTIHISFLSVLLNVLVCCTCAPLDQIVVSNSPEVGIPEGITGDGFVLPVFDTRISDRVQEIRTNREGFLYGPPLLGNTSVFPIGILGQAMVKRDKQLWFRDVAYVTEKVNEHELPKAARTLAMVCRILKLTSTRLTYYPGRGSPESLKL